MRWSKARHHMLGKLQEVERARRSAAEALLSSARAEAEEALSRSDEARAARDAAELGWSRHHSSGRLDLDISRLLAGELLDREREQGERDKKLLEAEEQESRRRDAWRSLEAKVRSGDEVLSRGRRALARRAEASRDNMLSDRTTWRWFQR